MSSVLTVSQLNSYVGFKLKQDSKLKGVAVSGEITNFTLYSRSGHMYFSLSDGKATVNAVMFSSNALRLKFRPEDGLMVTAYCNVELYERDGKFQIIVIDMIPQGKGTNLLDLEALKDKLTKLGVFDPEIKRPLCDRPQEIAVVTSVDGAALQDIINVVSRRCPLCKLTVYPCSVQGLQAPEEIEKALILAGKSTADTIILARGGGSAEDLSAFNAERVVMAVYNSSIPVISAVGHEIDISLCDYAADKRAPTPSAAAELAVPDLSLIVGDIDRLFGYVTRLVSTKIDTMSTETNHLSLRIAALSPQKRLLSNEDKLSSLSARLESAFTKKLSLCEATLAGVTAKLSALNPLNVLERGYALVTEEGKVIKSKEALYKGDKISIRFSDGSVQAVVI